MPLLPARSHPRSPRSHGLPWLGRVARVACLPLAVAAIVALLPGCGGINAADFDADVCSNEQRNELDGVTPAVAVDYLEVRSDADPAKPVAVIARRGVPCATATDKPRCESTLATLRPSDIAAPKREAPRDRRYLVFTRGDEIGTIKTPEEARRFLAPFENAKDAALLVTEFSEHRIQCGGNNVRTDGDAFELFTNTGTGCGEDEDINAHVLRVSRDGLLAIVETDEEEDGDEDCVPAE